MASRKRAAAAPNAANAANAASDVAATAAASRYRRLDQREHVLQRPGMYIGTLAPGPAEAWVYEGGGLVERDVTYSPAFMQTFLEILTNATDHAIRTLGEERPADRVTRIAVTVDAAGGWLAVENNGRGIDCGEHPEYGVRVPELVFGSLLTSSNFDEVDAEARTVAGQNGIGAKATNIFSSRFRVETLDAAARLQYAQEWSDNMSVRGEAVVTKPKGAVKPMTRVSYLPDYGRFGMEAGLDADAVALVSKCCLDACAVTPPGVKVFLDLGDGAGPADLGVKTFRQYAALYAPDCVSETFGPPGAPGAEWEVAVAASPDGLRQVSFVNGLCTPKGGKHVDHVVAALCRKLSARLSTKTRTVAVKSVRAALWVFVKASVPNPSFDSQNKHCLTSSLPAGVRYEPSDAFVKALLAKTGIAERVTALGVADDASKLKKTDGAQRSSVSGLPKLDDANWAGTKKSRLCTLILTEGDSAKSTAIAGLSVVGRDRYGVFPLRGKLLNVRDSAAAKIGETEEIKAIKKIMGLESGRDYATEADRCALRYGSVLLLTDADVDGFHIKGLILNLFHSLWPALARQPGFLRAMLTPIVKARPKAGKAPPLSFYSLPGFEAWRAGASTDVSRWTVKYYKGLGTSTSEDAKEYFSEMKTLAYTCEGKRAAYTCEGKRAAAGGGADLKPKRRKTEPPIELEDKDRVCIRLDVGPDGRVALVVLRDDADALDMAFRKSRSEERKRWLDNMRRDVCIEVEAGDVSLTDFVNKELALFSWDDVSRSLPGAVDGLKRSQRKVLFGVKKSTSGETRVAQLAAYVGQVSAYHHGEASLQQTIVGLAQGYVGSGHVQLLTAAGQFGSRIMGGKDAASPRYIYTQQSPAARRFFPDADEAVLERNVDDDFKPVEPRSYLPVLPLVLLNGAVGIGTGYSTNLPCFEPRLVRDAYVARLETGSAAAFVPLEDPPPHYRGFVGTFLKLNGKWNSVGVHARDAKARRVDVTELPVGVWTADYKAFLEDLCSDPKSRYKRYESHYTETEVRFSVFYDGEAPDEETLVTDLRLRSDRGLSMTNVHLLDEEERVRRFSSVREIAELHFGLRYDGYVARIAHQLEQARRALGFAAARAAFVAEVIDKTIDLAAWSEAELARHARARGWPAGGSVETPEDGEDEEKPHRYDYLFNMPVRSLTPARYARLLEERDREAAAAEALARLRPETAWLADIAALQI